MSASSTLTVRVVGEDGELGAAIGTASLAGGRVRYSGSNVIESMLGRMAANGKRTEQQAFELLAEEPWSNGKVWIGVSTDD